MQYVNKIVNLTPHEINLHRDGGMVTTIEPSGTVARVEQVREDTTPLLFGEVAIETTRSTFGEITGLPEPQDGVIYIVSGLVLARTNRADVFAPGDAVRHIDSGRVIGCRGLSASSEVVAPPTPRDIMWLVQDSETKARGRDYGGPIINYLWSKYTKNDTYLDVLNHDPAQKERADRIWNYMSAR
jgi:hypothetical protein